MLFVLLIILFTVITISKIYKCANENLQITKIPGPKSWPFIGNSHHFLLPLDGLFSYLRKLKKIHGGIYKIYALNMRCINITDPADVEIILSSNYFIEKHYPYTFMKPWLREGLLISNGNKWHHRRKLLTRAFHFNILRKYFRTFTEHTEELLVDMQAEVGRDGTNVLPLFSKATLKIMFDTAMGNTIRTYSDTISGCEKYFKGIEIIGQSIVHRICRLWLYADILFSCSSHGIAQKNAIKHLHDFTIKIIRSRKQQINSNLSKSDKNSNDGVYGQNSELTMLDLLLENEKEGTINIEGIREEVDTFMFEGHDTTAVALSFMIMRIANESKIQDLIYEEMYSIFGKSNRSATIDDLNQMKYLECCIKESLRLYPSVPFIARHITKEVELSGYKIPPGTICNIHIYDLHRNDDVFPEAEKFIPERFLPENSLRRHPYSYIPFSAGPRNCIGQKFAILEMKTVMSSLLRRFRLEPVTKPENIIFTCDLVLRAKHPIFVRFSPRQSRHSIST